MTWIAYAPWPVLGAAASCVFFVAYVLSIVIRPHATSRATFVRYTASTRWYERVFFALGLGLDVSSVGTMNHANSSVLAGGLVTLVYFAGPAIPAALIVALYRANTRSQADTDGKPRHGTAGVRDSTTLPRSRTRRH